MSTIRLDLPESLHQQLRELAEVERVSIHQWVSSALAEKMSAVMTEGYLEERARRGSRGKHERVLAKVKDAEPEPQDRL